MYQVLTGTIVDNIGPILSQISFSNCPFDIELLAYILALVLLLSSHIGLTLFYLCLLVLAYILVNQPSYIGVLFSFQLSILGTL